MGDDDASATFHSTIKRLLNYLLALLVQSGRRFVQDENLRVLNEGTGNGHSLLLSTRELRALQAAYLLEARVQLLLELSHFSSVDQLIKHGAILLLDALTTIQADVALEVLFGSRAQDALLVLLTEVFTDGVAVELTLVHLEGQAHLSFLLSCQLVIILVEVGADTLGLRLEQEGTQDGLPRHI